MNDQTIFIKGARVNNLKNIDVAIPRDKLVVITGLSGSGKSSLAFDTLYAEGQRRYVESLSSYARQFLGRMGKPECDYIKGIPPAIAIEQKVTTRNPRSTVGTSTEIYDYLRMLYARIGVVYSPVSGLAVVKHSAEDVVATMLTHPLGTKFLVLSPFLLHDRTLVEQLDILLKEGFTRIEYKGEIHPIQAFISTQEDIDISDLNLLIDRGMCSEEQDEISRLTDSVETAFFEGDDTCLLRFLLPEGVESFYFSKRFEADGIQFEEPHDQMFSFNNAGGACPTCEGFGKTMGIDENLVVPNKALSIYQDAVLCWRGEKMGEWKEELIRAADKVGFPIHRPYYQLTQAERKMLWEGTPYFGGIDQFFKMVEENQYKIQFRVMLSRYRGKTICRTCGGTRLKPEAQYVKIGGATITELVTLPITRLLPFFENLQLTATQAQVAKRLLTEIKSRLHFMLEVGLGYLTLDRLSGSLSGGESQRINLATSLGSSLVGSLYILDEPSIGLHPRDTHLLIGVLRKLQSLGNTVVVVEHDEEIMRAADYLIDIGPEAGRLGGEVVYQGDLSHLYDAPRSFTVKYLNGEEQIEIPTIRRKWNNFIEVIGAVQNNLKNVTVKFPLNVFTVVTGVSGSGKSTLVREIFYKSLARMINETGDVPGACTAIEGDIHLIKSIEFVDQNPIGKSSRSNPATYIKAYDDIRKLYADQQAAKQMRFTPAFFSFNVEGGRCEECKGDGTITVSMQFMADITLTCESCHGKRFKPEVLEILYKGKSITDVLDMTINQAIEFFGEGKGVVEKKITKRLQYLQEVGLGYIKMGQSSSTLSGGENQRVKLALFLSNEKQDPTLFVFDEPTTGLHFHDIKKLLRALNALVEKGHTVVVIEHNIDVIKTADYVIDMGPEGGDAGGMLVVAGTPEEVAVCPQSYTGTYLKRVLHL